MTPLMPLFAMPLLLALSWLSAREMTTEVHAHPLRSAPEMRHSSRTTRTASVLLQWLHLM
jgi:hypothetical protein